MREVVRPFQEAMDLIMAGEVDAGFAALGALPEWFGEVVYTGGPGMVSPGGTTEVVAFLEPGTYVIECYVKTEDGVFHSALGMIDEIMVAEDPHGAAPPDADLVVTLANPDPDDGSAPESGIDVTGVRGAVAKPRRSATFDAERRSGGYGGLRRTQGSAAVACTGGQPGEPPDGIAKGDVRPLPRTPSV